MKIQIVTSETIQHFDQTLSVHRYFLLADIVAAKSTNKSSQSDNRWHKAIPGMSNVLRWWMSTGQRNEKIKSRSELIDSSALWKCLLLWFKKHIHLSIKKNFYFTWRHFYLYNTVLPGCSLLVMNLLPQPVCTTENIYRKYTSRQQY